MAIGSDPTHPKVVADPNDDVQGHAYRRMSLPNDATLGVAGAPQDEVEPPRTMSRVTRSAAPPSPTTSPLTRRSRRPKKGTSKVTLSAAWRTATTTSRVMSPVGGAWSRTTTSRATRPAPSSDRGHRPAPIQRSVPHLPRPPSRGRGSVVPGVSRPGAGPENFPLSPSARRREIPPTASRTGQGVGGAATAVQEGWVCASRAVAPARSGPFRAG